MVYCWQIEAFFNSTYVRDMFEITHCDQETGFILVEDKDFGLEYEFIEPELKQAVIVNDYDLHITTKDGQQKVLPILTR